MLTAYQLKNARIMLHFTQVEFADLLGRPSRVVSDWENKRVICRKDSVLAIKYLLMRAGLYAHFRMIYMRKNKVIDIDFKKRARVTKKIKRPLLLADALKFKYDV